jgi:hypothetical protein
MSRLQSLLRKRQLEVLAYRSQSKSYVRGQVARHYWKPLRCRRIGTVSDNMFGPDVYADAINADGLPDMDPPPKDPVPISCSAHGLVR